MLTLPYNFLEEYDKLFSQAEPVRQPSFSTLRPSVRSRNILVHGEVLVVVAVKDLTDSPRQFFSTQHGVGLHHLPLAVHPLRLNRVDPGTFNGQLTHEDPHPFCSFFNLPVVGSNPLPHLGADVPAGIVPDQGQHPLANRLKVRAAPGQILCGEGTHWPSIDKP